MIDYTLSTYILRRRGKLILEKSAEERKTTSPPLFLKMTDDILSAIMLYSAILTLAGCAVAVVHRFACQSQSSDTDTDADADNVPRATICVDSEPEMITDTENPLPIEVLADRNNTIAIPEPVIAKVVIIQ